MKTADLTRILNRAFATVVLGWLWLLGLSLLYHQDRLIGFAFLLLSPFLLTVVHELGHAAAAIAVGWRVWAINVFPLEWRVSHPRLRFCKYRARSDIGGQVTGTPGDQDKNTRLRDVVFTLGGAIANALSGILLLLAARPSEQDFVDAPYDLPRALMLAFAIWSFLVAGAALWPMRDKATGGPNDGMIIRDILHSHSHSSHTASAIGYAHSLWSSGIGPQFWDQWITDGVEQAAHDNDSHAPAAHYLLALRAIEQDNLRIARAHVEKIKLLTPKWDQVSFLEAFLAAFLDNDPAAVERTLAKQKTPPNDQELSRFRHLALTYLVKQDGDATAASQKLAALHNDLKADPNHPHSFWMAQIKRAT